MEHYFTGKPGTPHNVQLLDFEFRGTDFKFYTDAGVFSRDRVDYGSEVFLKALPPLKGSLLDLGCGYGALGVTLAKVNPEVQVTMVDVNERAAELAAKNLELNTVNNARVLVSDGLDKITGTYDYIISNPPIRAGKKVFYPWFEAVPSFLNPGGWLCIVIQKKQGAPSAEAKLKEIFGNCTALDKSGGYWILRSIYEGAR